MPRFEIEIDEKGESFVGDVPAELTGILTRTETMAYGNGVRNGRSTAAEEAKKQIEETLRSERTKWESQYAVDRDKHQLTDEENKILKSQVLELSRESQKTLQARENAHATEILQRAEALKVRDTKIRALVTQNLKSLAASAGAREESLSELEVILGASIGFDDAMDPYVKGTDGQPRLLHGKPMSVEAFVKDYLDTHPHHRKADPRRGGGAPGGASFRNLGVTPTAEQAQARIHGGDRSSGAINELWEASRKRAVN